MTPGKSLASTMYFAMVPLPEPGAPARKMISLGNTMFSMPASDTHTAHAPPFPLAAKWDDTATQPLTEFLDKRAPGTIEDQLRLNRVNLGIG